MTYDSKWLNEISAELFERKDFFPLKDILRDSVYYPACGIDGSPIQNLNNLSSSFIYSDYGIDEREMKNEIDSTGLRGYEIFAQKVVDNRLIIPADYTPSCRPDPLVDARFEDDLFKDYLNTWIKPFNALWTILNRLDDFNDDHGPERLSLLFLSADGVTIYAVLYNNNQVKPLVFCIICPGTGLGHNWTDFRNPEEIMYRIVSKNKAGKPDYMMVDYQAWPGYTNMVRKIYNQRNEWRYMLYKAN